MRAELADAFRCVERTEDRRAGSSVRILLRNFRLVGARAAEAISGILAARLEPGLQTNDTVWFAIASRRCLRVQPVRNASLKSLFGHPISDRS